MQVTQSEGSVGGKTRVSSLQQKQPLTTTSVQGRASVPSRSAPAPAPSALPLLQNVFTHQDVSRRWWVRVQLRVPLTHHPAASGLSQTLTKPLLQEPAVAEWLFLSPSNAFARLSSFIFCSSNALSASDSGPAVVTPCGQQRAAARPPRDTRVNGSSLGRAGAGSSPAPLPAVKQRPLLFPGQKDNPLLKHTAFQDKGGGNLEHSKPSSPLHSRRWVVSSSLVVSPAFQGF